MMAHHFLSECLDAGCGRCPIPCSVCGRIGLAACSDTEQWCVDCTPPRYRGWWGDLESHASWARERDHYREVLEHIEFMLRRRQTTRDSALADQAKNVLRTWRCLPLCAGGCGQAGTSEHSEPGGGTFWLCDACLAACAEVAREGQYVTLEETDDGF